jgi:predicted nucleic acid-binding protein
MTTAVVDTSVVVALADAHDKWHTHAVALRDALLSSKVALLYFDCVINEAIGVIGRRAEEQRRSEQFEFLLDGLIKLIPARAITWISGTGERLLPEILAMCRQHQGKLNYHEQNLSVIVSFDGDFDDVPWLERIFEPISASHLASHP